jgi:hypothetical protein
MDTDLIVIGSCYAVAALCLAVAAVYGVEAFFQMVRPGMVGRATSLFRGKACE